MEVNLKVKKSIYIGLLTFFVSIYILSVAHSGMFDFLKKGMTKSWKIHKDNLSFCNGSLIVVEDGYKLLKIAPKRKQHKNKEAEKEGVWGFKLKIKADLLYVKSLLHYEDLKDLEHKAKEAIEHQAKEELEHQTKEERDFLIRLLLRELQNEQARKSIIISYKLFDKDGFALATSKKKIMPAHAKMSSNEQISIDEFSSLEKNGFVEILREGRISLEDIERVSKREVTIDFNAN